MLYKGNRFPVLEHCAVTCIARGWRQTSSALDWVINLIFQSRYSRYPLKMGIWWAPESAWTLLILIVVIGVMIPCSLAGDYQYFKETWSRKLQVTPKTWKLPARQLKPTKPQTKFSPSRKSQTINCDGIAQSIKLWSQKTPLVGKHVQKHVANNREAVFSVVPAVFVATQCALNTWQQ
jgi:hypothetical protein